MTTLIRTVPPFSWRKVRWGLLGLCWLATVGIGLAQVWHFCALQETGAAAQTDPEPRGGRP